MFAPKVAKPQTKATASSTNSLARQSSTLVASRPGLSTVEEVRTLQRTIGNQATLRILAQRTPSQVGPRGHNEQKAYPASLTAPGTNSRVSWDFSKVPLFPPDRASLPQARSCISALSLPNIIQPKLVVGEANDPLEHEADRVADQVMSGLAVSVAGGPPQISRKCTDCAPHLVSDVLRGPGQVLDAPTKAFMESRMGHDFRHVRVHTGDLAAESARLAGARAFTVGSHIVLGQGEYAPSSLDGRHLLAHELAHVVQQTASHPGAAPTNVLQRAPTISVVDENFIGPLTATERRVAVSNAITCCDNHLGSLHALPQFSHASRSRIVAAGSVEATGVGAAIHFIAEGKQPPPGDRCHCDDYRIIQVLETTHPAPGRGGNSYVDNNGTNTPFYSDVFLGGRGEHAIPAGYPDAGERLKTTESIYDRPYRSTADLGGRSLSWMAESCVACVKNAEPDRVLGCVTYGFTRNFDAAKGDFDPVIGVGPGTRAAPSDHFVNTLRSDPTTSGYDFKTAPGILECYATPPGDYVLPDKSTRVA
jgi:hypothetical protein